jgi:hypothetical protein
MIVVDRRMLREERSCSDLNRCNGCYRQVARSFQGLGDPIGTMPTLKETLSHAAQVN